ncbi:uncharacterized protein N7483_007115 [Penicillium malachiteum]|uniref:uncharacterized protein n=1 Tax=Penicillium malachiteum TaxID=1324776 RepID=UPI002549A33C|nr:uncharacterized protein N7483_007115 [Penicillium malachiteum]KAJ5725758.1 hypothetical protein N7483_007115 [Penicillium malachiteum]
MSNNTETFTADLYGEVGRHHPSMGNLKGQLTTDVKVKLIDTIATRPDTAYVDLDGIIRKVAEHGRLYDDAFDENITFGPDGSSTHGNYWKGWTTAHIKATFHFEDL